MVILTAVHLHLLSGAITIPTTTTTPEGEGVVVEVEVERYSFGVMCVENSHFSLHLIHSIDVREQEEGDDRAAHGLFRYKRADHENDRNSIRCSKDLHSGELMRNNSYQGGVHLQGTETGDQCTLFPFAVDSRTNASQ